MITIFPLRFIKGNPGRGLNCSICNTAFDVVTNIYNADTNRALEAEIKLQLKMLENANSTENLEIFGFLPLELLIIKHSKSIVWNNLQYKALKLAINTFCNSKGFADLQQKIIEAIKLVPNLTVDLEDKQDNEDHIYIITDMGPAITFLKTNNIKC